MEFSCYDIKELVFDMNLRENSGLVVKSLRVHFKQKQVGSDHTRCCQAATIPATIAGMPLYGFHACPVLHYSSHDIDIPRSNTSYSSIWYILYRESWKKGYDVSVSKYIVIPFGKLYRGAPNRTRNSGHSARPRKKGTGNCFLGNFKNVEIHRIEVSVLMLWGVYKVGPITPRSRVITPVTHL